MNICIGLGRIKIGITIAICSFNNEIKINLKVMKNYKIKV